MSGARPERRRLLAWGLVGAAIFALGACNDDGGASDDGRAYVEAYRGVGTEFVRTTSALGDGADGRPQPPNADDLGALVDDAILATQKHVEAMEAIDPPTDYAEQHDAMIDVMVAFVEGLSLIDADDQSLSRSDVMELASTAFGDYDEISDGIERDVAG